MLASAHATKQVGHCSHLNASEAHLALQDANACDQALSGRQFTYLLQGIK